LPEATATESPTTMLLCSN